MVSLLQIIGGHVVGSPPGWRMYVAGDLLEAVRKRRTCSFWISETLDLFESDGRVRRVGRGMSASI